MIRNLGQFTVGVDLGQSQDFTAIAVVELVEEVGERDPATYEYRRTPGLQLRYLERIALGTPYPEVVERVALVTRSSPIEGRCELVVDGTGVGRPVVDLLREADLRCTLRPVIVTGSGEESSSGGYYRVPKRDLIAGVQVLLQTDRLRIAPALPLAAGLVGEMQSMEVRVTAAGNEQFGAWRRGTHDDLVFAVALACWGSQKFQRYTARPRGGWELFGLR